MVGKAIVISMVTAAVMLLLIVQTTNPSTAGPLGLLAVFFLIYVIIIGVVTEVLWLGSRLFQVVARRFTSKRPPGRMSLAKAYYLSTVLAFGPVIAIAMQSIGSLGPYEVVLITIFVAIGLLYVSRRSLR